MPGFGAVGTSAVGALPDSDVLKQLSLTISSLIIPQEKVSEGVLVRSTSAIWLEITSQLRQNWEFAYKIPPEKFEELIAGAFKKEGYDKVVLTARSGDHGRDVIAIKHGIGCVKIIASVKVKQCGNLVRYDDVRALTGVMSSERNVSKGIITTTSDFPPRIESDPFIAPFMPTRLELINGDKLRSWLMKLV